MLSSFVLFFCGILFSLLGNLAGLGGGVFLVPLLIVGYHASVEVAVGVSLLSISPALAYTSFINWRKGLIDSRLIFLIELPALIAAWAGAYFTEFVSQEALLYGFIVWLVFLSMRFLRPPKEMSPWVRWLRRLNALAPRWALGEEHQLSVWGAAVVGGVAGLLAGVLGVGGGIIKTPMLISVLGLPARESVANVLAMIAVTSLAAGISHAQLGHVDQSLLMASVPGFFIGSILAQRLLARLKDAILPQIVGWVLLLAAMALTLRAAFLSSI